MKKHRDFFYRNLAQFTSVILQSRFDPELSGIIMEINNLQKTFLDNQPLAQTILEINDLREFSSCF
jgi:hypothetical protein